MTHSVHQHQTEALEGQIKTAIESIDEMMKTVETGAFQKKRILLIGGTNQKNWQLY